MIAGGWSLQCFVTPTWQALRREEPTLRRGAFGGLGQSISLAVLGGWRTLVADVAWLQMYACWERRDWVAVDTLVRSVSAIDPAPLYFWLNGARIMACDFPAWRIAALGGNQAVPASVQTRIGREQATAGLAFLADGMAYHPASSELWVERAAIELHRLGDPAAAAESYRRAWQLPHAPYYAARLHAQLLRQIGRPREALTWLVQLHPALPRAEPAAAADVVLERIRELEEELRVPPEKSYQALP